MSEKPLSIVILYKRKIVFQSTGNVTNVLTELFSYLNALEGLGKIVEEDRAEKHKKTVNKIPTKKAEVN